MNNYQKKKQEAIDRAIEFQYKLSDTSLSYLELVHYQDFFIRLARRYGLTKEFRENGII